MKSSISASGTAGKRPPGRERTSTCVMPLCQQASRLGHEQQRPGFCGKCLVGDAQVEVALAAGLPRACEWALKMGTDTVSCFAFDRDDTAPIHSTDVPELVIQRLSEMADITAAHGCRLALENEAGCWGATGLEAAHICRAVGADRLSLLWDPGNSCMAGSRAPLEEYAELKDLVSHVHCKNFVEPGDWSLMETGVVDWPAQVRALEQDGYDGFLVIETHLHIRPDAFAVADVAVDRNLGLEQNSEANLRFLNDKCLRGARL